MAERHELASFFEFVVADRLQGLAVVEGRPEDLEACSRRRRREEERAAPEALQANRSIGLSVGGHENAILSDLLRLPAHDGQEVSVWIGVQRARPQRLLGEGHWVIVGVLVVDIRPTGARVHGVAQNPIDEALEGANGIVRRRAAQRVERRTARRRLRVAAAAAAPEPIGQPHLPSKVRPQRVRKVGAVGLQLERRLFVVAEVVVEDVVARVPQHGVQVPPSRVALQRIVEEGLDERAVQVLGVRSPLADRLPDRAVAPLSWTRRGLHDNALTGEHTHALPEHGGDLSLGGFGHLEDLGVRWPPEVANRGGHQARPRLVEESELRAPEGRALRRDDPQRSAAVGHLR